MCHSSFILYLFRISLMASNETRSFDEIYSTPFGKILMAISLACICILGVIGKFINSLMSRRDSLFFGENISFPSG